MLRIRDVYPGSRLFSIRDPNFFHPGSTSRNLSISSFNPKISFLGSRKYDPGCSSRIRIPVKKAPDPGSRIQGSKRHRIPDPGSRIPEPQHWDSFMRSFPVFCEEKPRNIKSNLKIHLFFTYFPCRGTSLIPYNTLLCIGVRVYCVYSKIWIFFIEQSAALRMRTSLQHVSKNDHIKIFVNHKLNNLVGPYTFVVFCWDMNIAVLKM